MNEDHESVEPTGERVERPVSGEAVSGGPPEFPAAPIRTDAGAGGWMWVPPPPPPGAPGGMVGGAQWVGPPGAYWGVSPIPQPHRRRAPTILLVVGLLLIGMAAGFGIGHVAWKSRSTSLPSASSPSSGSPSFPFGSGTSPFGSGTSPFGSGTSPFGSGSYPFGSGSVSSASGGPSNASAIALRVDPGLVDVNTTLGYLSEEAAGTGIVLTSTGEVLTNNHVVDGATSIRVTDVGNGRVYTATVVGYDRSSDIAVLKLHDASALKVASLGDSSTVRRGEAVVGIGNAGGVGGTPSVAGGSVKALDQSITATEQDGGNPENLGGLIEVNAYIQAGDSGGPLVNTSGKVVGMDTAASVGFSFQTTGTDGYAIPINSAVAIAKKIESGHSSPSVHIGPTGFLGVQVESSQSGSSPSGAVIHEVLPGSPAASGGLVAGDVITSLAGAAVHSAPGLTSLMQLHHPGDRLKVGWTDSTGGRHAATLRLATGPAA
jgi:S1-C subfamily serine protease